MVNVIIFTKDRDCQLNLLVQSMDKFLNGNQYENIIIQETGKDFELATKRAINSDCEYTMFLPDDCMFTREVDFDDIECFLHGDVICLSLRLGENIKYDIPLGLHLEIPKLMCQFQNGVALFEWKGQAGYWGYPMSIDGHIFRTKEISEVINKLSFTNPNELETRLSRNPINHDYMAAHYTSCLINLVLNRVQTTHLNNKSGNFTTEYLQARYDAGHRLDLDKMVKSVANANACHVIPTKLYWKGGNE